MSLSFRILRTLLITEIANTLCCFKMTSKVYFRTVASCSSGTVLSICSSIKDVLKGTSLAKRPSTVNSVPVGKSPILISSVILYKAILGSLTQIKETVTLPFIILIKCQ